MSIHKVEKESRNEHYLDHLLQTTIKKPKQDRSFRIALASSIWLTLGAIWLPGFGSFRVIEMQPSTPKQRPIQVTLAAKAKQVVQSHPRQQQKQRTPMPEFLVEDIQPDLELEDLEAPDIVENHSSVFEPLLPEAPPSLEPSIYGRDTVGLEPPVITKKVSPNYPKRALSIKLQGYVMLEAILGKDGQIRDIKVLRGLGKSKFGFEKSAMEALERWEFQPGKLNNEPVDVRMSLTLRFSIR